MGVRRVLVLVALACAALTPAVSEGAEPIVCSARLALNDDLGVALTATGTVVCDQAVVHQLDVAIQTTTPHIGTPPVSVPPVNMPQVSVGMLNLPMGWGANACPSCEEIEAQAATAIVPGVAYDIGVIDFLIGPEGSTFADTRSCDTLFPRNTAICSASAEYPA